MNNGDRYFPAKPIIYAAANGQHFQAGKLNYFSDPANFSQFESVYRAVRQAEGRFYPDEIVKQLPDIPRRQPLYAEWQTRKNSLEKLLRFLENKPRPFSVLDLGCGNGWMSARLAQIPGSAVFAVDLNETELQQGVRVFGGKENLFFIYGDIFANLFPPLKFDAIILASCVQYFSNIKILLKCLLNLLGENGEIHIIDSPFYDAHSIPSTKQRTKLYYQKIGFPEMRRYYFHHLINDIGIYQPQIIYNPDRLSHRFKRRFFNPFLSPFPWMIIKNMRKKGLETGDETTGEEE